MNWRRGIGIRKSWTSDPLSATFRNEDGTGYYVHEEARITLPDGEIGSKPDASWNVAEAITDNTLAPLCLSRL